MTNRNLPTLNPLKARSTLASGIAVMGIVSPLLGGGIGEVVTSIVTNQDALTQNFDTAINSINTLVGIGGLTWAWFERRAPNFRLSFR